jgi:hypothetical protein
MSRLRSYIPKAMLSYSNSTASASSSVATIVLAVVAATSFLIYLFAFVYPYNLFELYPYPRLAVYRFAQDDPMVIWWLAAAFVIQCGLYWLGWRAAQHTSGKTAWLIVLGGALTFSLVLLFIYPFDAADIFDYAMHGRIVSVYSGNPFRDVAEQFPNDPFYPYAAWQHAPSFYGPAWVLAAAGVTRLAGDGIITNVLAFKLVGGFFLAASVGLVAVILRQTAPERLLAGVTLLAWNPVILYVTLGNGHNDIIMVFCILAAVWALLRRRYTLTILALVLGTLFKFIPALLLPAAGLIALRSLPDLRARLRFVVIATFSSLALIALAYAPLWYGVEILDMSQRTRLFTASLPAFFYTWLQPILGQEQAAFTVSLTSISLTVLFALWQGWRASRQASWLSFSQATINILLFYLLLTCSWFQQWYAVWPLGVAAVLPPGPTVYLAMILGGYTVLSKQIIFGPLIFRLHPFPRAWREIWFAPTVLGLPWLYAIFSLADGFLQRIIGSEEQLTSVDG